MRDIFEDSTFFTTVRIVVSQSDRPGSSIGTGFFFRTSLPDRAGDLFFIVSNKHVLTGKGNVEVKFHRCKDDGQTRDLSKPWDMSSETPDLGKTLDVSGDQYDLVYHQHPNQQIDLACMNITPLLHEHRIYFRAISREAACIDFIDAGVVPGGDVWFVGYPDGRFDVAHNLPLMRRGHIASLPHIDFNGSKQIVIDAQVFPGSSGSPVHTLTAKNKLTFIGVITQTMIRKGKLQAIPSIAEEMGVDEVIGLGILLKAELVIELIDAAVERYTREHPLQEKAKT